MELRISGFTHDKEVEIHIQVEDVIQIAVAASREILKIYNTDIENWNSSFAGDESPLSHAQNIAFKIIYNGLQERYPTIPIISESRVPDYFDRKEYKYYFCVSPLDGYKEFVRRNGQFSVNIGLCHDKFPVLGVVCVPCKSSFSKESVPRVYYSLDGHGAFVRPIPSLSETDPNPDEDNDGLVEMTPHRLECKEFFETDENLRIVMSSLGAVSPLRASLSSSDITPERLLSKYKNPVIVSTSGSSILHRSDSGFGSSSSHDPTSSTSTAISAVESTNPSTSTFSKPLIVIPPYTLSSQLGSQSIVLNILLLAEGKADCYPRLSMSCEWNTCASHAILNEAGGEIVQLANGMDNSTQCIPGEQLIYNKPHPINPYFVAYGKRLIPAHLLSHDYGLGIPAGLPTNGVSTSPTGNSELESKYYTMLAIQAKQEELKRLLDLQDLEYEKQLQQQREDNNGEVESLEQQHPEEKSDASEVELNRPKTLSLSLGLLGIFVAVAVCCLGVLYQIQHKPINL